MSHLDNLLEKHKQLQERSIFKSIYEPQEVQSNMNIAYAQNMNNYYNPVYYMPQENWFQPPLPPFLPPQYLQMPQQFYPPQFFQPFPQFYPPQFLQPPLPPPLPPAPPQPPPPPPPPPTSATVGKVYVNPNYNRTAACINQIQAKPFIHVNPKLMHNVTNSHIQNSLSRTKTQNTNNFTQPNNQNNRSVYVNPKMMNKLISNLPEENQITQQEHNISSTIIQKEQNCDNLNKSDSSKILIENNYSIMDNTNKKENFISDCSNEVSENCELQTRKLSKNSVSPKKNSNSNLISVSQSKLVRIRKNSKSAISLKSPMKRRLSSSGIKKINWYDKSIKSPSKKKVLNVNVGDNSTGLISIGGIIYKSSRNRLIRSSPSKIIEKSSLSNSNMLCNFDETNEELLDSNSTKEKISNIDDSSDKMNTSSSSLQNFKTNVSYKVKQKSLQILRNKMRKNNQPCLLFQKYGYCANQVTGMCSKVHDKKQIAVCRNFLQGKCLVDKCPLSHDVGPEKMPTCKYFLEGCCARDGCPYLHVKVSSKNPICVEFLRGYCPEGNECLKRHIHACPEFDKNGSCSKGKYCLYPHKTPLFNDLKRKSTRHKINASNTKQPKTNLIELEKVKCSKRYYERETSEDLSPIKEKLLKNVEIIKNVYTFNSSNKNECKNFEEEKISKPENPEMCNENSNTLCNKPRRPPIGPLPAYIPIE